MCEVIQVRVNHSRKFEGDDIANLFRELKRNPSIASLKDYNDFSYTKNKTLTNPQIECEYWIRLSVSGCLTGNDDYSIVHVDYAGK